MALTADQLQTLKTDIQANSGPGGDFETIPDTPDGDQAIADLYNETASPDFWVIRTSVEVDDMISGIDFDEYLLLGDANRDGIDLLMRNGTYNPAPENARDALVSLLPAGTAVNTRNGILDVSVRLATRGESVLSTPATGPAGGDGSAKTSSALLTHEGDITRFAVRDAKDLP